MNGAISFGSVSPEPCWNALIAEWLAGLFMGPLSTNTLASYRDGLGATLLDILTDELGCLSGTKQMRTALTTDMSSTAVARKLAVAFSLLFEGGGSGTTSLYESAHVSESGRLFQTPVSDMNRLLRQADMSTDERFREPADHLSIELALLARLMRRRTGNQAQIVLLDDHLLVWAPVFADRCGQADRTGFYAGAAQVLTGFLVAVRTMLQPTRTDVIRPAKPRTGVTRW